MVIVPNNQVDWTLSWQVPFWWDCNSWILSSWTCWLAFAWSVLWSFTVAITDEVITQANEKFADISDVINPNAYTKLAASFSDISKEGLNLINKVLKPVVSFFADNSGALIGLLIVFSSTVLNKAIPAIKQLGENLQDKLGKSLSAASISFSKFLKKQADFKQGFSNIFDKTSPAIRNIQRDLENLAKTEGIKLLPGETVDNKLVNQLTQDVLRSEKGGPYIYESVKGRPVDALN